ncbi:MAG: hypothetical protein R2752_00560 [Vicinamibacterales bacterium]
MRGRLAAGALLFVVLATANSGGYRYGVSDQAFYQPAVVAALDADAFPRDRRLLDTQTGLLLSDDLLAAASRVTGASLPAVFFAVYLLSGLALFVAAVAFGRALGFGGWATTAFVLLLTFRHRIARTGANSLEGYMHPRMFAFAFGALALAAVARRRFGLAVLGVAAAAVWHPTTALWFGVAVAAAAVASRPDRWRLWLGLGATAGVAAIWALVAGPLAGRLVVMDPEWLSVIEGKDYLFPTDWPLYAWVLNLLYPVVIVAMLRQRARAGVAAPGERALVAGLLTLVLVWAVSVPLTWMKLAVAVQFQVTRVFWLLDFVTAGLVAWWLVEGAPWRGRRAGAMVVAVLAAASTGRGVFLLTVEAPERRLVQVDLPDTPWIDALRWLRGQPKSWQILADPEHGWKYGVSARVGAERDTVLETGKDTAMAMYDRAMAMRVRDRLAALTDFPSRSTSEIAVLARRFDADVVIAAADHPLALPELYRNAGFVVYAAR